MAEDILITGLDDGTVDVTPGAGAMQTFGPKGPDVPEGVSGVSHIRTWSFDGIGGPRTWIWDTNHQGSACPSTEETYMDFEINVATNGEWVMANLSSMQQPLLIGMQTDHPSGGWGTRCAITTNVQGVIITPSSMVSGVSGGEFLPVGSCRESAFIRVSKIKGDYSLNISSLDGSAIVRSEITNKVLPVCKDLCDAFLPQFTRLVT